MNPATARYYIPYTLESLSPVIVGRSTIVDDVCDIVFIGKNRLEYGEVFNENVLHLLENFAAPSSPSNPDEPDLTTVVPNLLRNPTVGQTWYNSTNDVLYAWNGQQWLPTGGYDQAAGNSGVIFHGQQIPLPIGSDGYPYSYDECTWVVSPFGFTDSNPVVYIDCYTNGNGEVFMHYLNQGDTAAKNGYVNYQILGIKNTSLHGVPPNTPNIPGLTPTPTPTPTMTVTPSVTPTMTVTPTISRTPPNTRQPTPTPSTTLSNTPTPTVTRTVTPTPTVTPTITPTITPSRLPEWVAISVHVDIIPVENGTGLPCNVVPNPVECWGATIGDEQTIVTECFVGGDSAERITTTYRCTLQDICGF